MKTRRDKSDSKHMPEDAERVAKEVVDIPGDQANGVQSDPAHLPLIKRIWQSYLQRKKWAMPLTVAAILAVVFGVPWSRYKLLGLVVKKDSSVVVVESETGKPVSEVDVSLAGKTAKTDGEGKAVIGGVRIGHTNLVIAKKYYKDHNEKVLVDLSQSKNSKEIRIEATGRQVPVSVTNKINGKGLKGVKIAILDTEAETDDKGDATLVLPADKTTEKVTLKLDGYNDNSAEIEISEQLTDKNKLSLTPSGKLYFLSKRSGKIDVVKTNLDGSDRQTVLAGTGKEQDGDTVLLASRDWKYLALLARREGEKAKLYLIETAKDKLTVMDEGKASFSLIGWHNDRFVFQVNRDKELWEDKGSALKSYDAKSGQLKTLDETQAGGTNENFYVRESLGTTYILDNLLVYTKYWNSSYTVPLDDKAITISSIRPDGSNKKTLRSFAYPQLNEYASIQARLYNPQEIYFQIYTSAGKPVFYEYENGEAKEAKDATQDSFNKFIRPTCSLLVAKKRFGTSRVTARTRSLSATKMVMTKKSLLR